MKPTALIAAMLLALAGAVAPAAAQGQYLQVEGWVQWIAADRMQLVLDNGLSLAIDLTRVPQDQYRTLAQRDRVAVVGVVSSDNRRLMASSITRSEAWGTQSP
jgi:hypothetical protein